LPCGATTVVHLRVPVVNSESREEDSGCVA
jgi:hypothetical protein